MTHPVPTLDSRATASLHLEVRLDGKKYDPLFRLPPAGPTTVAAVSPAADGVP